MRGIPKSFKTKQDILNTHKLAMRRQVDVDEWRYILNTFITPNKYILPILKNEGTCFYIPYTELPLPEEYSNNKRVDHFIDETNLNNFTKPTPEPENGDFSNLPGHDQTMPLNPSKPITKPEDIKNAEDMIKTKSGVYATEEDIKNGFDSEYGKYPEADPNIDNGFGVVPNTDPTPENPDPNMGVIPQEPPFMPEYPSYPDYPGMGPGPDFNPNPEPQKSGGSLPMLKVYANVDPELKELVIYYGYPVLEDTLFTKEDILQMIKELS